MSCLSAQISSFGLFQASPPPAFPSTWAADWVGLLTWVSGLVSKITGPIMHSGPSLNHWAQPLRHDFEGDTVERKRPQFSVMTSYSLINSFF